MKNYLTINYNNKSKKKQKKGKEIVYNLVYSILNLIKNKTTTTKLKKNWVKFSCWFSFFENKRRKKKKKKRVKRALIMHTTYSNSTTYTHIHTQIHTYHCTNIHTQIRRKWERALTYYFVDLYAMLFSYKLYFCVLIFFN